MVPDTLLMTSFLDAFQFNFYGGAFANLAFDVHGAVMFLDDFIADG